MTNGGRRIGSSPASRQHASHSTLVIKVETKQAMASIGKNGPGSLDHAIARTLAVAGDAQERT
jgi:hypothetical protein